MHPPVSSPGVGVICARLLPPSRLVLPSLSFQYPLKLISTSTSSSKCLTVFILSYGGGLVSNDAISLSVTIEDSAKLCLLTQGSTKIFKRKQPEHLTTQTLEVNLHVNSSLLLLPDPIQPFASSAYKQHQRFRLPNDDSASLVVLDWVTEGRSALSEHWDCHSFVSRNELFRERDDGTWRLMLRDAMILERWGNEPDDIRDRMDGFTVFATMVIHGPKFSGLCAQITDIFKKEPRVGGKNFDGKAQKIQKAPQGVLWTVANIRGFLLVKVSGKILEDVRTFLRTLLSEGEGAKEIIEEFGEGSLLSLQ
ncbi:UreD urease accessory protein-domain-containing protein [Geopyxis carbonaria]|nr:UreD urease accessory protein-domain-containing protein [Geopyxis carbonaria]